MKSEKHKKAKVAGKRSFGAALPNSGGGGGHVLVGSWSTAKEASNDAVLQW